ncbi:MAG: hypothetical protein PHC69_10730 [Ruminiclostridium sp.]|nr:hypothetical protein [Ruminiclostridium sp.]
MALDSGNIMVSDITKTKASSSIGEIGFEYVPSKVHIDGVHKILFDGLRKILINFKSVFNNKRKLIIALISAAIWILLMLLPMFSINNKFIRWLSNLTFAQGGMSNDILIIIGGIFGKSIVATFYVLLFSGGLKNVSVGLKRVLSSFKFSNMMQLGTLLFGAGAALIIYNFMVGFAYIGNSIVGISALILTLNSLGSKTGFIRRLFTSITAKKIQEKRTENSGMLIRMLSGLTIGFGLSVVLSTIPFEYTPYYVGGVAIAAALVLTILEKKNKKEVTP